MTAGPRHTRHFIASAARDDGADLDDVVVGEAGVAGHELAVADHQHRLPVEAEPLDEGERR